MENSNLRFNKEFVLQYGQAVRDNKEPLEDIYNSMVSVYTDNGKAIQPDIFRDVLSYACQLTEVDKTEIEAGFRYGNIPLARKLTSLTLAELRYTEHAISDSLPCLGKRDSIQWQKTSMRNLADVDKSYLVLLNQMRKRFNIDIIGSGKRVLNLTLSKEWFDIMITGEKKQEYRSPSPWIEARLIGRTYELIKFINGYGNSKPFFICEYKGYNIVRYNKILEYSTRKLQIIKGQYCIELGDMIETGNINQ